MAVAGYHMKLIMPANMSEERRAAMAAFGAELISVPGGKMELARDLAAALQVPRQARVCRPGVLGISLALRFSN